MDINIKIKFEEVINPDLIRIIISNSSDKNISSVIKIRPIIIKDELVFQVSNLVKDKIHHKNHTKEEIIQLLPDWFGGLFRQVEMITKTSQVFILISKKGKVTIKNKKLQYLDDSNQGDQDIVCHHHNKKKNYLLEEGMPLPFLIDLGVMTKEGKVIQSKYDKFRQVNRFLEYIQDVLPHLDKEKEITILDFGCGKSYLTFAMYHYLNIMNGFNINVIGLDLKEDVVNHCNKLKKDYGYDNLKFLQGDIENYEGKGQVDMVVSLHACNKATDYALVKAVKWNAKVILAVPCCQHELNSQIDCEPLNPIFKYGIIKERISALMTDALRANILEGMGYNVQLLEFIDMAHTPKNILIRAVKKSTQDRDVLKKENDTEDIMEFLGVDPTMWKLVKEL